MKSLIALLTKNKPGILLGLGIGSMIMATISGIRYAPAAARDIEEKKKEYNGEKVPAPEIIKTAGLYFLPSALFTTTGIACIVGGNQMNVNRGAAAMAAYALSEATLRDYRDKTREIVGEKKEKDIKEAVAKEIMDREVTPNKLVVLTGNGDSLCYDQIARQLFRANINKIEKIINKLNFDMRSSNVITVDEYCLAMGLDTVILGNELGWDINRNGYITVSFTAELKDGEPCIVITHDTLPVPIH